MVTQWFDFKIKSQESQLQQLPLQKQTRHRLSILHLMYCLLCVELCLSFALEDVSMNLLVVNASMFTSILLALLNISLSLPSTIKSFSGSVIVSNFNICITKSKLNTTYLTRGNVLEIISFQKNFDMGCLDSKVLNSFYWPI